MRTRNILKKTLAVVLAFAMLAPIMGNLEVNVKEAKASETTSSVVSDDSLDVKFQVTQGVVTETDIEAYKGKYVLRAVSAVQDPEAYDYIRFKAVRADEIEEGMTDDQIEALAGEVKVKTVFKRIDSTTGSASGEKETYTYSPKVIDTNSEYFATGKFVIAEKNKDVDYVIWVCGSKNGTKVSGPKRQVCVNDGIEGCSTINMSFKNTSGVALTKGDALTAKNVDQDSNELGTYNADIIGVYGNTVNVRVNKKDASEVAISLKSANKFDFYTTGESATLVGSEILRHHTTKYNGSNADTSWYYLCAKDNVRDDFIIATSADLYGFAYLINTKHYSLMQDRVYVIADIAVNEDDVTKWGTSLKTGGYDWTPIGNASYQFKGVFDAQMHTISGLYHSVGSVMYNGFFGRTQSATIKNLKLTNCYFRNEHQYFGSISGYDRDSTFDTIYSDAIVNGSSYNGGGLVGRTGNGTIMTNCWFDGRVASSRSGRVDIGGLVGIAYAETTTITNCLNTGAVTATNASGSYFSGLVGYVGADTGTTVATLQLNTSFNAGKVNVQTGNTAYGCFVGEVKDGSTLTLDTKSYATFESCGKRGYDSDNLIRTNKEARLKGVAAATTLQDASFDTDIWTLDSGYTPILKSFESSYVDDTWYKPNSNITEYVLYDAADLYGLSRLSQANDFEGITIKLGDNITVNDGNKDDWGTKAPERYWLPIGNKTTRFAGTFDSDLHTIQGLYLKTTSQYAGLFGITGDGAIIRNLKLKNSYFESTGMDLGSIVGACTGTNLIDTVFSDAIVSGSNARIGGLIGGGHGETTVQYCCYEGRVTNTSTTNRYTGGILGCLYDGCSAVITDCLNTGVVDVRAYTNNGIGILAGGIVGGTKNTTTNIRIANCLMVGKILVNEEAMPKHFSLLTGYYSGSKTLNNNYAVIPSEWTEEIQNAAYGTKPTEVNKSDITGDNAKATLTGFDFYNVWSMRENNTPILIMKSETRDEYIVHDVADLIEIAAMSQATNFAGKTIKLANDIDLAEYQWTPMGGDNSAKRFAGTFDGQDHTISGINVNATSNYTGLFAATATSAQIKNLILKDSQFVSTADYVGTVVGFALGGTFSNIRVENTKISGRGRLGGLIGSNGNAATTATITMNNCSFDGTITSPGTEKDYRYIGGLIGYVTGNMSLRMSNCMNSGTISANNNEASENPGVGGLVGCLMNIKSYEINSCLNVGEVNVKDTVTIEGEEVKVVGYGPIIGRITTTGTPLEIAESVNNYTVSSCLDADTVAGIISVDADAIKENAEATLPELDFETHWLAEAGNFPQVRFTTTGYVAVESIEVGETMLTKLTALYPETRELKQGDIHGHANNGGASDGTKTIAEWANQMKDPELDIDFAASLDHRETEHINIWKDHAENKHRFIYGSEIPTTIDKNTSNAMGLHYNMIFAKQADFVNVLQSEIPTGELLNPTIKDKFDYTTEDVTDDDYAQVVNGVTKYGHFKTPSFTREQFKLLIADVKLNNGFFVIAHPMISPSYITAENAMDAYFADEVGIEVMNTVMTGSNAETGYKIWKTLLKNDKRVWATTGSDTHEELKTNVLTSIYAKQNSDEASFGEAYVRYLREGNFTAGSVGIQMSVGSTQMGGTGSFADAYLEIGIGALHKSVYDSTHKYRVDVWAEDGIMYSQPLNATTEEGQMTYLRTKADPNCKYYRVEVYDVTTNTRIAIGNPIWNNAEYQNAQ